MASLLLLLFTISISSSSSSSCRSSCGTLPIRYPLSIDDGCGSPLYRRLLSCNPNPSDHSSPTLLLRTPSGSYPIISLSYLSHDSHLIISDPSMWTCNYSLSPSPVAPFSLDTSTSFSLSSKNSFLFLNCNPDSVIIEPRPAFCDRSPERCGSSCDSDAYLCRNFPGCPNFLAESSTTCCSYFPTSVESVRRMLRHCAGYAGVYWRAKGGGVGGGDEVAEYGIRVDFEIPVMAKCRSCVEEGKGTCGFDTATGDFLCLCAEGNSTTNCEDGSWKHRASAAGVIGVSAAVASVAGVAGFGALICYLRKKRSNKVVTCGVQSNENRLF